MQKQTINFKEAEGKTSRLRVRVIKAPIVDGQVLRRILTARAKALVL